MIKIFYKLIFFVLFLFTSVTPVLSQHFKGGLMIGFTGSQMDGDNLSGFNKFGFSGGVFASRNFNDLWGMQAELKFIMKGAAKPVTNIDPSIYRMTLYYYELPVLITLNTSKKTKVESGLAIAYLSKANFTNDQGYQNETTLFKRTDISWVGGIYYILDDNFSINLKYSYSLKRVSFFIYNMTIWGTYGQYNNVLDLSLYYTLK